MVDKSKTHIITGLDKKKRLQIKFAIYGLGHVGSAIASVWLRAGAHVIGVDKVPIVLDNARKGKTHLPEPGVSEAYTQGLKEKRFEVYEDPVKASHESNCKMICVPVLASDGSADLKAVIEVATAIGKGLKKGDIVVLNPSVPPGTTQDIVIPIIQENSGLKVEKDFYMVYNPERIYEGRAIEDIEERYPAIVAGAGPKSLDVGSKLFSQVFKKGVMKITSIRTAETEKLLEGVYRDVNIALANELAKFCEKVGVNFWEAREAANSQPFCHIHKPGAGVGGACIPVYPQFILHTAARYKVNCDITGLARQVNDNMPAFCVEEAMKLIPSNEKKTSVALLGLAFRGNVSDTRLSPTYKVIEELERLNVKEIRVHDPYVKRDSSIESRKGITLTPNLHQAVKGADLAILVTDHSQYAKLSQKDFGSVPVYDGRGILNGSKFQSVPFAVIGGRSSSISKSS